MRGRLVRGGWRGGISEEIHADRILMSIIINSRLLVFVFCSVRPHERLLWIFGNFATEVAEIFANYISHVFPVFFFFLLVTVRELLKSDGGSVGIEKNLGAGRSEV
jgi:hypothetical protein